MTISPKASSRMLRLVHTTKVNMEAVNVSPVEWHFTLQVSFCCRGFVFVALCFLLLNNECQSLLLALGAAVGFGNVWRFPSLAKDYGGGAVSFKFSSG